MTDVLLFLHILAAIVLLGPLMLAHVVVPVILRRGREGVGLARFFHTMESRLAPATLLILLLGIALVEDLDLDYGAIWIWLAITLVIVATVIGAAGVGPAEQRAIDAIEGGNDASPWITRVQVLGLVNIVVLSVIVWLMVDKPL